VAYRLSQVEKRDDKMKLLQVFSAWQKWRMFWASALIVVGLSACTIAPRSTPTPTPPQLATPTPIQTAGDFQLVIAEPHQIMVYGPNTRPEPVTFTVTIEAVGEWTTPVTLSLQGPLHPTQYSFSPNPVTPPAGSFLTIHTSVVSSFGRQSLTLTVVGMSDSRVRSQEVRLDVPEVFPPPPSPTP
jgi:hypothetical protein